MAKAALYELTAAAMKENSSITALKELGIIFELEEETIMENERTIKCMAKEFFDGRTEEYTKANILKTKNKVLAFLRQKMEKSMKAFGTMENNMVKGFYIQLVV